MKKIITTLLLALAAALCVGQRPGQEAITTRYDLTSGLAVDTILPYNYDFQYRSYQWRVDVVWDSLTGTLDGVLKIKMSGLPDTYLVDTAWVDYPLMSSVTMSTAAGYASFEDTGLLGRKIGLYIDVNNITAGVVRAWITLKPTD